MTTLKVRTSDKGTAYAKALIDGAKVGMANATDPQVMAHFCEYNLQTFMGAFSPRLVWEGAQAKGMTARQLTALCTPKNARARRAANQALDDLQWAS